MLNLCSVLLDLCMPFCSGDDAKLSKISHSYSVSKSCTLNYNFEPCLAGGQIGDYTGILCAQCVVNGSK